MQRDVLAGWSLQFLGRLTGNPFSPGYMEAEPFVRFIDSPSDANEYGEIAAMAYCASDRTYINHRQYYELIADVVCCARQHIRDLRVIFVCNSEPSMIPICRDLLAADVFISCDANIARLHADGREGSFLSISDMIRPQRGGGDNSISIVSYGNVTRAEFAAFIESTKVFGSLDDRSLQEIADTN